MQYMRPFNPYVEDIDMYLEEAKERGLLVNNQDKLKSYAKRINEQNEQIIKRDEVAREHNTLKKKLKEDEKKDKKLPYSEYLKKFDKGEYMKYLKEFDKKQYKRYLRNFDKKYHKGIYKVNKKKDDIYSITSATYTGWLPRIWSANGVEVQPKFEDNNFEMSSFDIIVDSETKSSFSSNFPTIDTSWRNDNNNSDITTEKFLITDPFFSSLASAYRIFCQTGFSLQHLESLDPFVKSLSNYYVYYWMSVLQRQPVSPDEKTIKYLKENFPTEKIWEKQFHQGMETPTWWMKRQPEYKSHKIRNAKPVFAKERRFGQVGISYEKVTKIIPKKNAWKNLIPKTSTGFTPLGQKMFQQSLESLVFSILDAQAKTGWSVTGQGAKSFQTQDVFRKLVQDTIVQHDVTVTIANMKRAIKDTNVSLNFALIPDTILIPSDMRLQIKIPGFNNILTLVNKNGTSFGKNNNINSRDNKNADRTKSEKNQNKSQTPSLHETKWEKSDNSLSSDSNSGGDEKSSVETEIIGGVIAGILLRLLLV